jgi:hypothetical protein
MVRDMSGRCRGVLFPVVAVLAAVAVLSGCAASVDGSGDLAAGVLVPRTTAAPGPTASAQAVPSPSPAPAPRKRDPAATAHKVNLQAGDLPVGWRLIPGSTEDTNDSFDWVIVCARDAGVGPGTFAGAATPDWSPSGTDSTSQVGSVSGLFGTEAQAHAFVALFGDAAFGRCLAGEAGRRWGSVLSGAVPPFARRPYRVPPAPEARLMGAAARLGGGARVEFQFVPIRTGPIVTVLSMAWRPAPDAAVVAKAAAGVARRQHTA